ncbi:MAG TPA: ATP-binding protein [Anaerolineaceae bacterium]|nr:ATP-binding protein [Anaerolineaceae bacterium]
MLPDFRVRQRDYLLEIARALTQELNLDKLLERILDISIEMLAGQAGLIVLREQPSGWRIHVSRGIPAQFIRYIEPQLSKLPYHEDPKNFELTEIHRILNDATYMASLGLLTSVGLPLVVRRKVIGGIFIFRSYPDLFTTNDHSLLSAFANQAAIAVHNAQLYLQVNEEKQRMDALLDSAADGMLILGPNHRIERCNPALTRMLEQKPEQLVNQPHDEIIHWISKPQGLTLEQAVAGGWPLTPHANLYVEGDLARGEKPPLPVGITYAPLVSSEGNLLNIIATVRDITRFRQAEEVKSTFVSVISHELKTPVALIKGYAGTLRREDATWDRAVVQDSLQVIEEEADHLTELIENLLDASRLQAGALAIKRTDISLPDLANRLANRLQTQTSRHTLRVDFPPDFPILLADEQRIEQVLSNLVANAIKYAPEGDITIRGQIRPEQVIVCVSDRGPGIAPEDIPHIFDRFYRAPDAARHTKGAGLGLYLTRAIIEAHGGRIWVDPMPDQGARICFSLPRPVV